MNRVIAIVVALILWTVAAFVAGWQVRDGSADAAGAGVVAQQQEARADQAEEARATDHANAQTSAHVQEQRADSHAEAVTHFQIIEREVVRYVQANPDPVGCDLDGDGLRAWREANAGPGVDSPEPGHPGRPADP